MSHESRNMTGKTQDCLRSLITAEHLVKDDEDQTKLLLSIGKHTKQQHEEGEKQATVPKVCPKSLHALLLAWST